MTFAYQTVREWFALTVELSCFVEGAQSVDTKGERREKKKRNSRKMKVTGRSSIRVWIEMHTPKKEEKR